MKEYYHFFSSYQSKNGRGNGKFFGHEVLSLVSGNVLCIGKAWTFKIILGNNPRYLLSRKC